MDFKRLFLALSLSFVFIYVWQIFFMPPISDPNNINQLDQVPKQSVTTDSVYVEPAKNIDFTFNQSNKLEIETPLLIVKLNNGGSSISDLQIVEKTHKQSNELKHTGRWNKGGQYEQNMPVQLLNEQACNPCLMENGNLVVFDDNFELEYIDNQYVVQSFNGLGIIKTTIIHDDSYIIDHMFSNLSPGNNYQLMWTDGVEPTELNIQDDLIMLGAFTEEGNSYEEETIGDDNKILTYNNVGWAGLKTKYFMKAITNENYESNKIKNIKFESQKQLVNEKVEFIYSNISCDYGFGNEFINTFSYIGPIETKHLNSPRTSHLVQLFGFGWFIIGYLGQLVLWLLTSLYSIVPNYGVVCILFAFIVRIFTGPLTKQSFISNQKLQTLQPKIKKIQEKHKTDQAKLSQATMDLYKKEGVNPLGGCLPILVQMPLLIALFQVFRKTIEFRGAQFLPIWITDLSQPDIIIKLQFLENIPGISYFFGHGIALLPIIMGIIMFLSMKMTATTTEPSAKFAMYFMNGFFILLFNTFPSGLNLYYTMYNILNFIQQRQLKKLQS